MKSTEKPLIHLKKCHFYGFVGYFEQSLTPTLILADHEFECKNVKSIHRNGPNAGPKPISVMPEIAKDSYFPFPLKSVIRLLAKSGKINGPGGPLKVSPLNPPENSTHF